ncbi:DNA polymerase III subunit gamma/tau [bacterium]|nr:DNA polymerase III subunit gamma/tau [bacterium]
MQNTTLYRKYRPKSWDEVYGQDHVVSVLKGAIKDGTIAHAYLFAGSRGTGKTSVARIFAAEIGTGSNDLYEIDAASNRGIDDVRELREGVRTLPFGSKYKVYIIDEVHMLTKDAFNALLKTLEEPPAHVIFILATTEKEKVLDTVISRCETHIFKKPSQMLLKDAIIRTAESEGTKIDEPSADLVALLGDGSFRDALGILQKVISSSKGKITLPDVERVSGAPRQELINDIVRSIAERDAEKGLAAIQKAADENMDMKVLSSLLLRKMRAILIFRHAPRMKEAAAHNFTPEELAFMENIAGDRSANISSEILRELLLADALLSRAHVPELPLELAIIELTRKENE